LAKKEANQEVVVQKTCLVACSAKSQKDHKKPNPLFIQLNVLLRISIMERIAESRLVETGFALDVLAKVVIKEIM
jgi:hypothetical protein